MPIYEFYCADCNTVFGFFTREIGTSRRPDCPRCGRSRLERRPSRFATAGAAGRDDGLDEADALAGLDGEALERAMEGLAREAGDGEDPRAMAAALRAFGRRSGLELGPRIEELLERLESGADPDVIEADLDDAAEDSPEDYFRIKRALAGARRRRPEVDDEIYFL